MPIPTQNLYIGGAWCAGVAVQPVADRWTGEHFADVAVGGPHEAAAAVDAASAALAEGLPVHQRAAILAATCAYIAEHAEAFAQSIQRETGKPITAARLEVTRGIGTLQFAAEEARRLPGEAVPLDATSAGIGTIAVTIAEPRGIVAAITPFNFPLNLVIHKVGPAIAAGCPVVLKPSSKAPIVAGMLVRAFAESGLPAGWLNLVTGPADSIVGAWIRDDRVQVITFTGSSDVGWKLKADSPRKMHVLELGSNTAMYVHVDADVPRAVADAIVAGFGNSGQACVSLQRLYVHTGIADQFVESLVAATRKVVAGDPRDAATIVGPLIAADASERVMRWIGDAIAAGARVRVGGTMERGVVMPTVVTDVSPESPLLCKEVFGPVITVVVVSDLDEAVAQVNNSDFGLNAAIYTRDLATAMAFGRKAQAGSVLINMPPSFRADHMPYGGVKDSGEGREGVKYAIEEMVRQKLLVLKP